MYTNGNRTEMDTYNQWGDVLLQRDTYYNDGKTESSETFLQCTTSVPKELKVYQDNVDNSLEEDVLYDTSIIGSRLLSSVTYGTLGNSTGGTPNPESGESITDIKYTNGILSSFKLNGVQMTVTGVNGHLGATGNGISENLQYNDPRFVVSKTAKVNGHNETTIYHYNEFGILTDEILPNGTEIDF